MMKNKKYLMFDLDGTLIDPKIGITTTFVYVLKHFGIEREPDSLVKYIGPPLRQTFAEDFGMCPSDVEAAVSKYRELFAGRGVYEHTLYDGIVGLLRDLNTAGKTLVIVTSKITSSAETILRFNGLYELFAFISGDTLEGARSHKLELIEYAKESLGFEARDAVMIGDRHYDIDGAKQAGVSSIGVLYGYGGREEITFANPDHVAESVSELRKALL